MRMECKKMKSKKVKQIFTLSYYCDNLFLIDDI